MLRILFATIFYLTSFFAAAGEFSKFNDWVGEYPVRTIGGKKQNILEDKLIKSKFDTMLQASDRKRLDEFNQSLPIRKIEDFVVINKCRPKNCAPERSAIVLDLKRDRLWVGFFERFENKVVTRWIGNIDDSTYLPAAIVSDLGDRNKNQ